MDLVVMPLGPDDWQRSKAIRLRSLLDTPDAFWMTHAEEVDRDPSAWQELLSRDTSTTYLAVRDGQDVGCAVAAVHHADDGVAALYAMWVAPEARGAGVGDALLEAVKDWSRQRGFDVLRFDVGDHNDPAIALYARHGAVRTGRRETFPAPRDHLSEHELEIRMGEA